MKHIYYLLFIIYCFSNLNLKSTNFASNYIEIFSNNPNWKIEFQNSEIKVESAIINLTQPKDGISHEIVIFRYTNLTRKNISLSFNRSSYYGNVCVLVVTEKNRNLNWI